jgi:uncharacterized tellurite resistance protein B-like protein
MRSIPQRRLNDHMLKNMQQFFRTRIQSVMEVDDEATSEHALYLATAALLIEMTHADFHVSDDEKGAVKRALQKAFELSSQETNELISLAEQEVRDASSLYQFTDLIDKNFTLQQKRHVVEMLWRVAFADRHKDKYEEYLVRKVADLIHVSHKDFIQARHVVEDEITDK